MLIIKVIAVSMGLILCASAAHAGVEGDQIHVTFNSSIIFRGRVLPRSYDLGAATILGTSAQYIFGTRVQTLVEDGGINMSFAYGPPITPLSELIYTDTTKDFPGVYKLISTNMTGLTSANYSTDGNVFSIRLAGLQGTGYANFALISAVPEPENYAMLLSGIGLMGFIARRRKKRGLPGDPITQPACGPGSWCSTDRAPA